MWGSDYPHIEGTWPHTADKLAQAFADVPRVEGGEDARRERRPRSTASTSRSSQSLAAQIGPERGEIGR